MSLTAEQMDVALRDIEREMLDAIRVVGSGGVDYVVQTSSKNMSCTLILLCALGCELLQKAETMSSDSIQPWRRRTDGKSLIVSYRQVLFLTCALMRRKLSTKRFLTLTCLVSTRARLRNSWPPGNSG